MQEEGLLTARSINILGTFSVLKKKKEKKKSNSFQLSPLAGVIG